MADCRARYEIHYAGRAPLDFPARTAHAMIAGIGTDIVSVARIRRALERHGTRFARKVLADSEWSTYCGLADGTAFVAKRFAAKEAFYKALGQPSSAANTWHQLAVVNEKSGRPRLSFGAGLASLLACGGICAWHLSLADEQDHAIAFVVLEKEVI